MCKMNVSVLYISRKLYKTHSNVNLEISVVIVVDGNYEDLCMCTINVIMVRGCSYEKIFNMKKFPNTKISRSTVFGYVYLFVL